MTRLIQIIDGWILARVERASHQVQRVTGRDCFDQARVCMLLTAACALSGIFSLVRVPLWLAIPSLAITALAAGFYILAATRNAELDAWRRSNAERGFSNSLKASPEMQRMRVFGVISGVLFLFIPLAVVAVSTLSLYLDACDPLPPCRGKVRDWLSRPHQKHLLVTKPVALVRLP